jgi:type IV pilus biogenesis protein CpaD/CtpE
MTLRNRILLAPLGAGVMLLGGCFYHPPFDMPDASVIGYDGTRATPPDCRRLAVPAGLSDAGQRLPSVAWGCATYTNLAAQVARPSDLAAPSAVGPADAVTAAGAVERYRQNKVTPLDQGSSRDAK